MYQQSQSCIEAPLVSLSYRERPWIEIQGPNEYQIGSYFTSELSILD